MTGTATYRPEFEAALRLYAQVSEAMQARILLGLHPDAEMDYLERRIREETFGDYGIEHIQG